MSKAGATRAGFLCPRENAMQATIVERAPTNTFHDDAAILSATAAVANGALKAAVLRIDQGHYPVEIMAAFGEAGALGAHLDRNGGRTGVAISAMQAASRVCGTTGFLMWCHDVCGLYLEQSGNPALTGSVLDRHQRGETFGGTALSNPMKSLAGIEPILFRAVKVPGGYSITGSLPWVSHIGPGQYCGAMAGVFDPDGALSHEIVFILRFTDAVDLRPCPAFSGMEGSSTWGMRLQDHFIGEDDVVADPARPFIEKIKAVFILLQTGMAMGTVQGSIDSMWEVEQTLGHVNRFLDERPDELQGELDELGARIMKLAATPYDGSRDYLINVLDARAHGSELALRAAQSAMLHQGARGYLMSAAPQRRVREAHFVAIVTPAIKHLRWEIARLSQEENPQ